MLKRIAVIATLILVGLSPANSGMELTTETLYGALRRLGLYHNNKVTINGQLYHIENVSVSSNRREYIIRFVAKPTE